MLGCISTGLIMEKPDCAVGKLELGGLVAGLGGNKRQVGSSAPSNSVLFSSVIVEGGWSVPSHPLSLPYHPTQAVFSGPAGLWNLLPST